MPRLTAHQKKTLRTLLREAMLLRDGGKCLKCGKRDTLQTSHIYPKGRYKAMEYDLDNVKTLCFSCHLGWWHKNPIEAHGWIADAVAKKRLDRLKLMSQASGKLPDYYLTKIYLEQEIKRYGKDAKTKVSEMPA